MSDIERRKFTAEEGDHLTLLNGMFLCSPLHEVYLTSPLIVVYNAFVSRGRKSSKWAHSHRLNFKALSRALSIRQQLSRYLQRFGIPTNTSCGGDHSAIRRCLVSGYFKNAAKFGADGTYRLLREGGEGGSGEGKTAVLHVHPSSVMFTRTPSTGYVIFHDVVETTKIFMRDLTVIDSDWYVCPMFYEIICK